MSVDVTITKASSSDRLEIDLSPKSLAQRHATCVLRAALAGCSSRSDADDIVQKTFLKLVRLQPEFESDEHAKAWLLRVAINLCKDHHRSMWQREVGSLEQLQESSESAYEIARADNVLASSTGSESVTHNPEEALIKSEQRTAIKQAVAQLSAKQRICIHLFYYEDMKIEEIAQCNEMTTSTVKSHLHRGRAKLQTILGEEYDYEA